MATLYLIRPLCVALGFNTQWSLLRNIAISMTDLIAVYLYLFVLFFEKTHVNLIFLEIS